LVKEAVPQLTLVIKSKAEGFSEIVHEEDKNLIQTLSMLCSFYTVDDLCSFLYSDKFQLIDHVLYDLVFEMGLYSDHQITLDIIPRGKNMTLGDSKNTTCGSDQSLKQTISDWLIGVTN
tara:strand:+ start:60 stop:416 length:357 start_codon:yes stop_codon:yes gene_type:complete